MTDVNYSMLNDYLTSDNGFHCLGSLKITTGSITVGDPICQNFEVLAKKIKPGSYEVITYSLSENAAVFIQLSDKPAVRWENAEFVNGETEEQNSTEFEGYVVDSGVGCFVDSGDADSLGNVLNANDWLFYVDLIENARAFFYADLSDQVFNNLSEQLLHTERELRRVSGWQETLTAREPSEIGRERADLYRDFRSFADYITHIKGAQPEKAAQIDSLLSDRDQLVDQLTKWTEDNGLGRHLKSTRKFWDALNADNRQYVFNNFKHIVLDNVNQSNGFVFRTAYGDGVYPSFFGYDENDEVCVLITDFASVGMTWEDEDEG